MVIGVVCDVCPLAGDEKTVNIHVVGMKSFSPQSSGMLKSSDADAKSLDPFKRREFEIMAQKFKYLAKLSKCSAKH